MAKAYAKKLPKQMEDAADAEMSERPGVPMEVLPPKPLIERPEGIIARQMPSVKVFKRVGLDELTPVFGTAQPPSGLSGLLKSVAYKRPESAASHWALLLLSDRINALEGRAADAFTRPPFVGVILASLGIGAYALFQARAAATKAATRA